VTGCPGERCGCGVMNGAEEVADVNGGAVESGKSRRSRLSIPTLARGKLISDVFASKRLYQKSDIN